MSTTSPDRRSFVITSAIFAAVLFLAIAIAASGIISLFTDTEPLIETDAGPLVAPIMFVISAVVLVLLMATAGVRADPRRGPPLLLSVGFGVITTVVWLVTGAVIYVFASGEPVRGILFLAGNAVTLYALAVLIDGVLVAVSYALLLAARDRGGAGHAPQWPWEGEDDGGNIRKPSDRS